MKNAVFICSNTDYLKCPPAELPEYAFIGRSNVGKSSLINMLTTNNKLAKVSATPGKTQLINHFLIDGLWYLVDLPGYGWAKVGKEKKKTWEEMISNYLLYRQSLMCVFLLIDSRLEPQKIDIEFMENLANKDIPFVLVFTKADKQSSTKTQVLISKYKKQLLNHWEQLPKYFISSSETKTGRAEILAYIEELNQTFIKNP